MTKKKIYIALPLGKGRYKEPEFEETITSFLFTPNDYFECRPEHYGCLRGSPNIYMQRYNLALEFLKTDADYYLYIDSDQLLFPAEDGINPFEKLVRADVSIISPLIVRTFYPHFLACMSYERHKALKQRKYLLDDFRDKTRYPNDIIEVKYSCGGLCLIKREVIERVDKPFLPVFTKSGDMLGTDYSLYAKAQEKGFVCHIHRGINCGHKGDYIYTPDEYYQLLDSGQLETEYNEKTGKYELR